jgi:hypothetical protein
MLVPTLVQGHALFSQPLAMVLDQNSQRNPNRAVACSLAISPMEANA